MNPESSLKIRVAGGMAVVLAVIAGTVALRSHHSTSVAQIAQPSAAPIANAPAAVAPIPDAPATVAPIPDAPVAITNKDRDGAKTVDAASPAAVEPKVASNRHPAKAHSSADTTETLDKKRVDGVNSAREQMMPQEAPKSDELAASDGVITTEVKSQLAADSIGKDVDISVTTTHGIVVLTGTALTQDAIDHARGVAEKVKDVKSVDTSAMMIPAT